MQFFRPRSAFPKRRMAYLMRLVLNMLHYSLENYVVNRLNTELVHNDLGASFTAIERRKGFIIKRANPEGEEKLREEIEWILRFRDTDFERNLPVINRYSLERGNVFYEMKYYNYPNLRRIILSEMNARFFIRMRLLYLLELFDSSLWNESNGIDCPADFVRDEYFTKFQKRRKAAEEIEPYFEHFYSSSTIKLNGRLYLNAPVLLEALFADDAVVRQLTPPRLYISHGDLHSNNILCGFGYRNQILIDCRGKSSAGIPYFDPAYDIGKLFHDFHGMYSLIERHSYSIFHYPEAIPRIEYRFTDTRGRDNFKRFYAFIRAVSHRRLQRFGNLLERADFAEAMLFLTMIPMHLRMRDEGLICYCNGVKILNDWCAKYQKDLYKALCARHSIT